MRIIRSIAESFIRRPKLGGHFKLMFSDYVEWWKNWRCLPVKQWIKGSRLYNAKKWDEAIEVYLDGLEQYPKHNARHAARLDLAFCMFNVGNFKGAETELRTVTSVRPDIEDGHIRLARLLLWVSHPLSAAWTLRRASQKLQINPEMCALFIIAVAQNEGPDFLVKESLAVSRSLKSSDRCCALVRVAHAILELKFGDRELGMIELTKLVNTPGCPIEGVIGLSEALIEDGQIAPARSMLIRILERFPKHPHVLGLLAMGYLKDGELRNPHFAVQLSIDACQSTSWCSPRELHILADAYVAVGNKQAALIVAHKAKEVGGMLLSEYEKVGHLSKMINRLEA